MGQELLFSNSQEELIFRDWDAFTENAPLPFYQSIVHLSDVEQETADLFFQEHLETIQKKIRSRDSDLKKANTIFRYLHDEVFQQYDLYSRQEDLFTTHKYNCVTATSLYVSLGRAIGLNMEVIESPSHVYATLKSDGKSYNIELTAPQNGFNYKDNADEVIRRLVDSKLIPPSELNTKTVAQLYQEHVRGSAPISDKDLLGIHYHNLALLDLVENKVEQAFNSFHKAITLYPHAPIIEAYIEQLNLSFDHRSLSIQEKIDLHNQILSVTNIDTSIANTAVFHLSETIEDGLRADTIFSEALSLIKEAEEHYKSTNRVQEAIQSLYIYVYTTKAQDAALRGNLFTAKENLELALALSPNNQRLETYYISVVSNHALKLAQFGLLESARREIDSLTQQYPTGYPVIDDARVKVILAGLVRVESIEANEEKLRSDLTLARSIQPENIYLKSFATEVYHDLAMQQIRLSDYQKARTLVLEGLTFDAESDVLKADLRLLESIIEE